MKGERGWQENVEGREGIERGKVKRRKRGIDFKITKE